MSNIKRDVVNELHKPARKRFPRRPTIVKGIRDLLQADLVEMQPYSRFNRGHKYILVVIDVFSKFLWAIPVKTKTGRNVTDAMKVILLKPGALPKNLQTDHGVEFFNKDFKALMEKYGINHYSTYSTTKASVVERVNRTLKNLMWKQFSLQGNYSWLKILPKLVEQYNNTQHSTIGMKPVDVTKKVEQQLLRTVYHYPKVVDPRRAKFKVGDAVRISKHRHAFTKGYTPNWTNEIFTISRLLYTLPRTYILKDVNNAEIQGAFYEQELLKVKHPDVYLVEKVLRRKGKQVFVKWLGLPNTSNSWISRDNIM